MKKFTFRSLLAIAAAGVLFTACKDENDDGNTSKTTYEFSARRTCWTVHAARG